MSDLPFRRIAGIVSFLKKSPRRNYILPFRRIAGIVSFQKKSPRRNYLCTARTLVPVRPAQGALVFMYHWRRPESMRVFDRWLTAASESGLSEPNSDSSGGMHHLLPHVSNHCHV
jgi:hypothetical protein